uniref:Alanine--tRNA ligase n=1 Tax=Candidatus Kentrum sp. DK TaxID=2126562 RepID=A0A450SVQ2_9GAMM|nr:MAG: alanyl-tRNA synthetase [Candidatus Kentron sp. DK]VFJ60048.1 MAG: alanyl-tRNA synthetase [Candidatus Kentron sp. DK]
MITSKQLRAAFLRFFEERGHEVVPSSPLVPANDATLLFTNAGMVQFKEAFLGHERRAVPRAVSSQRCVRAGGKHNDLENVGYTDRHHTFFEMLGNFSFGDYFKHEAIDYAWTFLTQELKLPPERLWVTVFEDDQESADIWLKEFGISPDRFSRCGAKDNFWSMGDTGPCGPCSEIFYDHGPEVAGGPPGSPEEDGDRYVEIWNLVFMQFNRGTDGNLTPLPKPSVDTGMGLERLAAVLQGVHSTFETDLFRHLLEAAANIVGIAPSDTPPTQNKSLRVIADHIRSSAFLIIDGVFPSNEGRGYVLRRIIRRAVRHGHQLGMRDPFFFHLVAALSREMGDAYPELVAQQELVARVLRQEEERFSETLEQGMSLLEQVIDGLTGDVIPGEAVFRLYDTYGFPVDLTADVARERGFSLDYPGFDREMAKQKERARGANRFTAGTGKGAEELGVGERPCEFIGYEHLTGDAEVVAIRAMAPEDGKSSGAPSESGEMDRLRSGATGFVVLDRTPFYAESGGQVGDRGVLIAGNARFTVTDTKGHGGAILHIGRLEEGTLRVGDRVETRVEPAARSATARAHSATHLLHAAMREILGDHVTQKGSLVTPDRLRFDFSHFEPVQAEPLRAIERRVSKWIMENAEITTRIMPLKEAINAGATALFGEKYQDNVRVLSIGDCSTELCGGTHARRAGDIGLFKILSETGVAAGTRRIEALTGDAALDWIANNQERLLRVSGLLKADADKVEDKVSQLLVRNRDLTREVEKLGSALAAHQGGDLALDAVEVNGVRVLAKKLDNVDPKSLRNTLDQLKGKLGSAVIVLAAVQGGRIHLVAGTTPDCVDRLPAKELIGFVAGQVGGKGGGRPDMAQGGGDDPSRLDAALDSVTNWVKERYSIRK